MSRRSSKGSFVKKCDCCWVENIRFGLQRERIFRPTSSRWEARVPFCYIGCVPSITLFLSLEPLLLHIAFVSLSTRERMRTDDEGILIRGIGKKLMDPSI
jgi:hypothetical protein